MYTKIYNQIFDSTLAEDYVTRHVFIDLLLLCDCDGVVDMTADAIARRTNMPAGMILEAIAKLMKPDSQSRSEVEDGRRLMLIDSHRNWGWQVVNYQHYRNLRDGDARREYMRDYMRKRRVSSVNSVNSGKPQLAHASASASASADVNAKAKEHERANELTEFTEIYMERLRAIGFRHSEEINAEHALAEVLEAGAEANAVIESCCNIYLWTKQGKFAPRLADVIRRWREPRHLWERSEGKPNAKSTTVDFSGLSDDVPEHG